VCWLLQPLGMRVLFALKKTDNEPSNSDASMAKLAKWNESCWKLTCFSTFTVIALLVSYDEKWFTDTTYFWRGCTALPSTYPVSKELLFFYCMEAGFYLQSIPYLLFIETRRKDFLESMAHHVVTLVLLLYSYYLNLTSVGVMIMLLHDICDVPFELAKLLKYSNKQTAADASFAVFFVTWIVMRMVYFPLVVIRSCWYESITYAAIPHNIEPQPHHFILNAMLLVLFVLHTYWSYLIFQVLCRTLSGSGASDVREDDD
jgi:hypothetical protein